MDAASLVVGESFEQGANGATSVLLLGTGYSSDPRHIEGLDGELG